MRASTVLPLLMVAASVAPAFAYPVAPTQAASTDAVGAPAEPAGTSAQASAPEPNDAPGTRRKGQHAHRNAGPHGGHRLTDQDRSERGTQARLQGAPGHRHTGGPRRAQDQPERSGQSDQRRRPAPEEQTQQARRALDESEEELLARDFEESGAAPPPVRGAHLQTGRRYPQRVGVAQPHPQSQTQGFRQHRQHRLPTAEAPEDHEQTQHPRALYDSEEELLAREVDELDAAPSRGTHRHSGQGHMQDAGATQSRPPRFRQHRRPAPEAQEQTQHARAFDDLEGDLLAREFGEPGAARPAPPQGARRHTGQRHMQNAAAAAQPQPQSFRQHRQHRHLVAEDPEVQEQTQHARSFEDSEEVLLAREVGETGAAPVPGAHRHTGQRRPQFEHTAVGQAHGQRRHHPRPAVDESEQMTHVQRPPQQARAFDEDELLSREFDEELLARELAEDLDARAEAEDLVARKINWGEVGTVAGDIGKGILKFLKREDAELYERGLESDEELLARAVEELMARGPMVLDELD